MKRSIAHLKALDVYFQEIYRSLGCTCYRGAATTPEAWVPLAHRAADRVVHATLVLLVPSLSTRSPPRLLSVSR